MDKKPISDTDLSMQDIRRAARSTPKPAVTHIAEHTVAAGETLSDIALKYYGSAAKAKYMAIYEANKDVIGDNPNVIKAGQVLKIPKFEE